MKLDLKHEVKQYVAKNTGEVKEAINYYVDVPFGSVSIKVQVRPTDFTGQEILTNYFVGKEETK